MNNENAIIKFFAPVDEGSANQLMKVVDELINEGVEKMTLLISTPGGSVFHGLSLYNYLKGLPIEINTHNFGSVDSIGVVLYCAGKNRYSSPQARFLLHGVSAGFVNVRLEEPQLEESLKGLKMDMENISKVVSANTGKSEKDVNEAMLDRTTLNPKDAEKWGLVTKIKQEVFPAGSKIISIVNNNQNKIN